MTTRERVRPESVRGLMDRMRLAERFLPGCGTDDVSLLFQVGFVCRACYRRRRLTELRPLRVGEWWCPACAETVGVRGVDTYSWGQDDPLPTRAGGKRQPWREIG
jgi:hypothetical protein